MNEQHIRLIFIEYKHRRHAYERVIEQVQLLEQQIEETRDQRVQLEAEMAILQDDFEIDLNKMYEVYLEEREELNA